MREYGQIQCNIWTHPEFADLTDRGKLLMCYVLTCHHSNGIGCFRLPAAYVSADLGWVSETVSETLSELSRKGFLKVCERTKFVWIPKYLRWNPVANGNVAKAREREFQQIPSGFEYFSSLSNDLLEYGAHWSDAFRNRLETLSETVSETLSKQEPDPEPDPEPDISPDGDTSPASAGRPSPCPHQQIIELYHRILPELPVVRIWSDKRKKYLAARWREDPERQTLDWWTDFFNYVRSCDFLMGRVPPSGDRPPFQADLEWIVTSGNFVKIVEGRYEPKGRRHAVA